MNRIICLLLIWAFAAMQGLSLHAHLPHAGDTHVGHAAIHVHSHAVDHAADTVHEHSDVVPIDLLTATAARDDGSSQVAFAIVVLCALILAASWICIQRLSPLPVLIRSGPPPLRHCSPRAPPR